MTRIAPCLASCHASKRKALVTFITAGDPDPSVTVPALHALVDGGADILELGVPFSDPEAEGPAIQASSERALKAKVTLAQVLEIVSAFRKKDKETPVILMGYLNSIIRMGESVFATRAAAVGVDGVLMVNLPPEEADALQQVLLPEKINLIFLVAPTTTPERVKYIASKASGFIYYVSLKGITGADHLKLDSVAEGVARIREFSPLPVLVGFGIKDGTSARAVSEFADGVVVGSALVNTMGSPELKLAEIPGRLTMQLAEIRAALDAE